MATLPSTVASGDSAGGTPAGPLPGIPPPPPALAATPGHPALLPPAGAVAKQVVPLTGAVAQGDAGRPVAVQVSSGAADWADVGTVASAADGSFSVRWRPTLTGPVAMRAVLADPEGAEAADADPVLQLNVYRRVRASWYGPGFYGGRTACGRRLSPGMLGVANKSLPCGTEVELVYGGRSIVVPVIDRGPYANGASFDLTKITADRLGVDGVFNVGYAIIPV
ncbi:MAG TPA: septal ring lytic transglycosylase RlpA family protein [Solirubrobacteraceae bacterium]|nr:septal ring lytic transglycosylase RlpA family protein [Solirubrobacteraceae bacterium]